MNRQHRVFLYIIIIAMQYQLCDGLFHFFLYTQVLVKKYINEKHHNGVQTVELYRTY